MLTLAGATIAPTVSSVYAIVDTAAPAGTHTEAFSWLLAASLVGASLGSAAAGALAQTAGPALAFAVVASAGAIAVLVALLGSRNLCGASPEHHPGRRTHPEATNGHSTTIERGQVCAPTLA
ncbi:MAG: hypothetical protein JO243_07745 [Solirubrobacterales bacterium]|nr:hypothetical protein [Solirubrobacterales bacterium]